MNYRLVNLNDEVVGELQANDLKHAVKLAVNLLDGPKHVDFEEVEFKGMPNCAAFQVGGHFFCVYAYQVNKATLEVEPVKVWTADQIKENMRTNQVWLERGIIAIWKRQTEMEKAAEATVEHNSRGFNGLDAKILSSFAQWIQSGRKLTPKQAECARKKMMKYAGQLAKIANGGV